MKTSPWDVFHFESWFIAFRTGSAIFMFTSVKYAVINANMKHNLRDKIWLDYSISFLIRSRQEVAVIKTPVQFDIVL